MIGSLSPFSGVQILVIAIGPARVNSKYCSQTLVLQWFTSEKKLKARFRAGADNRQSRLCSRIDFVLSAYPEFPGLGEFALP